MELPSNLEVGQARRGGACRKQTIRHRQPRAQGLAGLQGQAPSPPRLSSHELWERTSLCPHSIAKSTRHALLLQGGLPGRGLCQGTGTGQKGAPWRLLQARSTVTEAGQSGPEITTTIREGEKGRGTVGRRHISEGSRLSQTAGS